MVYSFFGSLVVEELHSVMVEAVGSLLVMVDNGRSSDIVILQLMDPARLLSRVSSRSKDSYQSTLGERSN
jgi:hypothetical protein